MSELRKLPSLTDTRCSTCGSAEIAAIKPGTDPDIFDAQHDLFFPVTRGEPSSASCLRCLVAK